MIGRHAGMRGPRQASPKVHAKDSRMRSKLLKVAFLCLAAAPLVGTAVEPAIAETSLNVPAASYTVYSPHTQVIFGIRHLGLSTFYGTVGRVTGTLNFDPAQPEKSGLDVQIDM